jgi:SAM-dependent methyltransferase
MKRSKRLRNFVFRLLHPGNQCYCIYCQRSFSRFLPAGVKSPVFLKHQVVGGGYKKNILCPQCGSVGRQRLMALFFALRTEIMHKNTTILHISSDKNLVEFLKQYTSVTQEIGEYQMHKLGMSDRTHIDVQDMRFDDHIFDIVVCCHVLEHVQDDDRALSEIYRVLKPGGFAILQVPIALDLSKTIEDKSHVTNAERIAAYGQFDHVRLYGMDYFDMLENTGFRVVRDNPMRNHWMNDADLDRHCLEPAEDVILCYKDTPGQ